jgi:O-antigen/teichoic acid export membrane protein
MLSQVVVQLTRASAGLLIARELTPTDYGIAAMVVTFSGFVLVFSDLAFGAAIVQRKTVSEDDCSTVFWTTVLGGLVLTVGGIFVARPLAEFYGEPRVATLFTAFAAIFLITSLGATHQALLTREMDFRKLETRQIIASLVGAVTGITAALAGAGPWAIVLQQLAIVSTGTVVLWGLSRWRPKLRFSVQSLRKLAGFSGSVFATRLLYYTSESSVTLLVGRFLGASAVGMYAVAYTVILVPLLRIAVPVGEVLFPAFARLQDDRERLTELWLRALTVLAALVTPALLGLIVTAPDVIPLVLGSRWEGAVPVVQILAWVGLLQALDAWNGGILMGLGRSKLLFRSGLLFYTSFIASYAIGLRWGIVGVATSYAITITLMQFVYQAVTARALRISPLAPLRAVGRVAGAAIVMAILIAGLRVLLVDYDVPPVVRVILLIAAGTAIYVPLCLWREPRIPRELLSLGRRNTTAAASPSPSG